MLKKDNLNEGVIVRSKYIDFPLLTALLLLLSIGLVMAGSASLDISGSLFLSPFHIFFKQVLFVCIGIAIFIVNAVNTDGGHLSNKLAAFWAWHLFLLVLVLIIGREVNGSVRWISLGVFNLQASEAAKLCIVIYLAAYLDLQLDEVRKRWMGFGKPLLILGGAACLIIARA